MAVGAETHPHYLRLDKWLVYARFCKTRSQAAGLVAGGVRINGRKIEKPDTKLHMGDVLTIVIGADVQLIRVNQLAARRGSPAVAHNMYEVMPQSGGILE